MKPYFCKYLPVEGEFKKGEIVINIDAAPHFPFPWHGEHPQFFRKIKLFLCSRDVQIGDEVINSEIDSTPVTIQDIVKGSVWFQETPGRYKLKDCYKVIGEILTEGIKEDQEFTNKEVKFLTIGK